MSILLNELSLHGQFSSIQLFWESLERVIMLRKLAKKYGYEVESNDAIFNAQVTNSHKMNEAIQASSNKDRIRSVMVWLTKQGSLWNSQRKHSDEDYLSCGENIVTETSIGEAAYRISENEDASVLSFYPSSWEISPISIDFYGESGNKKKSCDVCNYWDKGSFSEYLESIKKPILSWGELERRMIEECKNITFSKGAFKALSPHPFVVGAAGRIIVLLKVLDQYAQCFDKNGARTDEGNEIYQNYFTGEKARFTDSSASEKIEFENELKFSLPKRSASKILCPWHGKVQTPQYRIHFAWPEQNGGNIDVVYIGPKVTKR